MTRLTKPVGQAVQNQPGDARYVQFLLNEWRALRGMEALAVDGIVGPLTNAAIRAFQQAETGLVDGQVDRDGPSIKKLEALHIATIVAHVNPIDPYSIHSGLPPVLGTLTPERMADHYLDELRKAQG
ncbi:peptidoglycan-binding protein [Reyranella sp.]|uniref:peptidoglycan-binding domain-containing protein n=1 Tax=Reyranella sp. TaxID=1929291 RepID=UPI0011F66292|nr:peptidoglycan-binding protein [Reyranella sp.]TAJ84532.1 MAG: hypothetical protein EPO50_17735 [Reyranella sp.]